MADTIDETIAALHDAGASDDEITGILKEKFGNSSAKPEQPSGGATAAITATRGALALPGLVKPAAAFVAAHPAAAQKAINAGVTGVAASAGAAVGGVPGAIAGGAIRGAVPAQTTIREIAGQYAGESPVAAKQAGRALGVQNYAKEVAGMKVKPADIVPTGSPASALDGFAESNGLRISRILGPDGKVISGPEALAAAPAAATGTGLLSRIAGLAHRASRFLAPVQGAAAVGDLAQMAEPTRRDIGFLGLGRTIPQSEIDAYIKQLAARNYANSH